MPKFECLVVQFSNFMTNLVIQKTVETVIEPSHYIITKSKVIKYNYRSSKFFKGHQNFWLICLIKRLYHKVSSKWFISISHQKVSDKCMIRILHQNVKECQRMPKNIKESQRISKMSKNVKLRQITSNNVK